jgi:hypothetical protein
MTATSLEAGLASRTADLKKLWETLKPRVPFIDQRRTKIDNYFTEIPARVNRREGYEAIFALTRIATMLGEVRIEFREVENGDNEGSTADSSAEEAPTNVHDIRGGSAQ